MKKFRIFVGLSVASLLLFLSLFFYFFKKSLNLRKALANAFLYWMILGNSLFGRPLPAQADFSSNDIPQHNRVYNSQDSITSQSGAGKPDNDSGTSSEYDHGLPQFVKPESVEQAERRICNLEKAGKELQTSLESDSESDSDSDSEQCPVEVVKVNENFSTKAVKKVASQSLKNPKLKREYERIFKRLQAGIDPIDLGDKSTAVGNGKVLIKAKRGRYLVSVSEGQVDILGFTARGNDKNLNKFKRLMNEIHDAKLKY